MLYSIAGTIGRVSIVTEDILPANTNQAVAIIRPNLEKISLQYLRYALINPELKKLLLSKVVHAVQANLSLTEIGNCPIPIPKSEEQQSMAKILSDLDSKIELNQQMNKTLESIGQAIFKRWFVDFEFPNEEGKPYKSSGGEMVDSELGPIPLNWEIKELGELSEIAKKTINPQELPNTDFQHYSIPAYDESESPVLSSGHEIKSIKSLVDNESVLVSKLNPEINRIWLPFVRGNDKAICSTEFIVYKPKKGISRIFIYHIVKTNKFLDFFSSLVTGSTGSRQRVPPKDTLKYKLTIPRDKTIVKYFCEITSPLLIRGALNLDQRSVLAQIRNFLLPRLMSGRIRVPLSKDHMEA